MRMTWSDIISHAQGATTTDSTIKTSLKQYGNQRYELITSKLNTWNQILTRTATSGDSNGDSMQYYYSPPNLREIESIVVTIGDRDYPLSPVDSQEEWDRYNASVIGASYPCKYFRRTYDYGLWPYGFEDDGTITINYTQRAVPLYFEDYTTGTCTVTENDQTVTVAGGANLTTGSVKAGFWFSLADSTGEPRGSWYKIGSVTDTTNLELETFFEESSESGASYIIGQSPEIPEEGHILIAIGMISDFYALKQKDLESATRFNNYFWTGNYNMTPLQAKEEEHLGGLMGLIKSYENRDSSHVVNRGSSTHEPLDFRTPITATLE